MRSTVTRALPIVALAAVATFALSRHAAADAKVLLAYTAIPRALLPPPAGERGSGAPLQSTERRVGEGGSGESQWPREASKRPSQNEWKQAQPLALTRSDDSRCRARRLREWVQIRCTFWSVDSVAMIAGNKAGVNAWVVTRDDFEDTGVIELQVRPGDRRVFQVNGAVRYGAVPEAIVQELWLEDDPDPTFLVQRS